MSLSIDIQNYITTTYLTDDEAIKYFRTQKSIYLKITKYISKRNYTYFQYLTSRDGNRKLNFMIKKLCLTDYEEFNILLDGVTEIEFSTDFRSQFPKLPESVTHLKFECKNIQSIDNLPDHIISLEVGHDLKQHFIKKLPKTLKHLILSANFKNLLCPLPESITHLEIGGYLVEQLQKFPSALTDLSILNEIDPEKISEMLSETSIINLELCENYNSKLTQYPKTLQSLKFGYRYDQETMELPESLMHLEFGISFNQKVDNLPLNLESLKFGSYFNQKVDNLPLNLRSINFGGNFNQSVECLPSNLRSIDFGTRFNKPVNNLPQHLEELRFGFNFNQEVNNLPKNLLLLKFEDDFNQNIDNLPDSITYLVLGKHFNQKINKLPRSLKYLYLHEWYLPNFISIPGFKETSDQFLTPALSSKIKYIYFYQYSDYNNRKLIIYTLEKSN